MYDVPHVLFFGVPMLEDGKVFRVQMPPLVRNLDTKDKKSQVKEWLSVHRMADWYGTLLLG